MSDSPACRRILITFKVNFYLYLQATVEYHRNQVAEINSHNVWDNFRMQLTNV